MRKIFILSAIILFTVSQTFAYSIKLYDEYGNRIGTYKKEGDEYQLYDFNDNKVDNPAMLIREEPDKRTLTEYSQTYYDENMNPVYTWRSGFYGSDGRYYPRNAIFYPTGVSGIRTPYIVRPHANNGTGIYQYADNNSSINYVDKRYAQFHKFK